MMFNVSIYYKAADPNSDLFESRFILGAQSASEARNKARKMMKEMYTGEVDDSTYLGGITYDVPGATAEKRLPITRKADV